MSAGIELDDLDRPRLPLPLRLVNAVPDPAAAAAVSLRSESLLAAAERRAGLSDFGDPWFLEPFEILVEALEREAGLSPLGRLTTRQLLVGLLVSRLRLEDLYRRHPEIEEVEIPRPVVIAGLPRTGTTHLHHLLARHPDLRFLPYWESVEPFPDPRVSVPPDRPDPRIRRAERSLRFLDRAMPHFRAMHEFEAGEPHEEIQLLALAFATQLFEASYRIPSYVRWYRETDQTPAYRYLRRILRALTWLRGGRRWLLKTPQHLENLAPLAATFPDATFVQTHRDPVRIAISLATIVAYGARMQQRRPDPVAIGRHWGRRVEDMLRASVEDRHRLPAAQVVDVHFPELQKDPLGTAARILEAAELPFGPEARAAMQDYLTTHQRGRFGRVRYRAEPLGLDEAELRERFRFYRERFGVADEAP